MNFAVFLFTTYIFNFYFSGLVYFFNFPGKFRVFTFHFPAQFLVNLSIFSIFPENSENSEFSLLSFLVNLFTFVIFSENSVFNFQLSFWRICLFFEVSRNSELITEPLFAIKLQSSNTFEQHHHRAESERCLVFVDYYPKMSSDSSSIDFASGIHLVKGLKCYFQNNQQSVERARKIDIT